MSPGRTSAPLKSVTLKSSPGCFGLSKRDGFAHKTLQRHVCNVGKTIAEKMKRSVNVRAGVRPISSFET